MARTHARIAGPEANTETRLFISDEPWFATVSHGRVLEGDFLPSVIENSLADPAIVVR